MVNDGYNGAYLWIEHDIPSGKLIVCELENGDF